MDRSRDSDIGGLRVFMGDPVIEHGGVFYMSRADYEFHLLPRLRPDLCGALPRQPHIIVVDPGHGGIDHGTENPEARHDGEDSTRWTSLSASGSSSRPRATR